MVTTLLLVNPSSSNSFRFNDNVPRLVIRLVRSVGINAYGFLKYAGFDVMKPDRDVRRVYRLGLIGSTDDTSEIRKKGQEIGQRMAKVVGERVNVVDEVVWLYGSGCKYVSKAICTERKPLCVECNLLKYCRLSHH